LRRLLEDAVEDVFHTALARGDLGSAEDLLGVMECIQAAGRLRFRAERIDTRPMFDCARNQLWSRRERLRPDNKSRHQIATQWRNITVPSDRYIKIALTIIAICQVIGAIRTVPPIPVIQQAMAHDSRPVMPELSATAGR
jgi:hypothetical protein